MSEESKTPPPEAHVIGTNWDNPADPSVKFFVDFDVEAFVAEYEFCGDDGYYTPNEQEQTLLVDAAHSLLSTIHEGLRKIPDDPSPQLREVSQ